MDCTPVKETRAGDLGDLPAIRHFASHLLFWCVAVGVLWLDLWSKRWVFAHLQSNEIRPVFDGVLDFRRSLNTGAVFGSFTGQTKLFIVASLFAFGFVVYLFFHSARRQRSLHLALALILAGALGNLYDRAFVVADVVEFRARSGEVATLVGKLVNLEGHDSIRIGDYPSGANPRVFAPEEVSVRRQGVVRDFIKFVPKFPAGTPRFGGRDMWPWVFNVADVALVIGVGLLLIHTWFDRRPRTPAG